MERERVIVEPLEAETPRLKRVQTEKLQKLPVKTPVAQSGNFGIFTHSAYSKLPYLPNHRMDFVKKQIHVGKSHL